MPNIRPLETLHNALSLRQLDFFLEYATSANFKTPGQSPPRLMPRTVVNAAGCGLPQAPGQPDNCKSDLPPMKGPCFLAEVVIGQQVTNHFETFELIRFL